MMKAVRRRWLASIVQPTIILKRPGALSGRHDITFTGTPAIVILSTVGVLVVAFILRFVVLRGQARLNARRRDEA